MWLRVDFLLVASIPCDHEPFLRYKVIGVDQEYYRVRKFVSKEYLETFIRDKCIENRFAYQYKLFHNQFSAFFFDSFPTFLNLEKKINLCKEFLKETIYYDHIITL